jgi:hypothetical protein
MKLEEFSKWFNRDFWRAFKDKTFPIKVPDKPEERFGTVRFVYESILSGTYAPSIPETEIILNKGHGVARTTPVFCIEDYIVFYFCIKELEEILCVNRTQNTFGGWSLGGKSRRLENEDIEQEHGFSSARYSFNPRAWSEAFGDFNSILYAQIDTGNYSHVLQFDLANFYDCVRLDILERWIREESSSDKGWIITLLFYFLNHWNRKNTGLHPQAVGLPQDALSDCSRVLANFYLQRYDRYAADLSLEFGGVYFRYSDDQMLLLRSTDSVERLMLLLTRALDRFGLRVNQRKVCVWEVGKLQRHRARAVLSLLQHSEDKNNAEAVREFAEAYLAIPLHELDEMWNRGEPLLNRMLFANLESLPSKILSQLLLRYCDTRYLCGATSYKLVRIDHLNSMQAKPCDFLNTLIQIGRDTYHNSFHFEVYAFAKRTNRPALASQFEARLKFLNQMTASRIMP